MLGTPSINLSDEIEKQLPAELVGLTKFAGELAQRRGQNLYLVGGVVRDLLLRRLNFDLDLVVEGDAVSLTKEIAKMMPAKVVIHARFGTAKLQKEPWTIDLATARSETYAKPGALPTVKPGTIQDDLFRRDFTINAMAVELNPSRYGQLLDLYGGRNDLRQKLLRVLHQKSFVDDATRIWRGLRYEQRLEFQLEPATLKLLRRDIDYLDTISGDRLRHELELVLKEAYPEKVLWRVGELSVLAKLHPALQSNGWLAQKFAQARQFSSPDLPSIGLYLGLLCYSLSTEENEQLISRLRFPKPLAQTLRDTLHLKANLALLANAEIAPSNIYSRLHGYSSVAIVANLIATDSPAVRQNLELFLNKLRYIRAALNGEDIKRLGVTEGPRIREILSLLLQARLDGKVTSRKDEEELVRGWLGGVKSEASRRGL